MSPLEPVMNTIVFESVHKIFGQRGFYFWRNPAVETRAVKGISFTVKPAEVLGLLGPNGSGKSTTLKLISTMLLPDCAGFWWVGTILAAMGKRYEVKWGSL